MGTLSHVFESEGLATVGISLVRSVTERLRPPRALYCRFPFGRPLGRPDDPEFQHQVIAAALGLLAEPRGPVLVDFEIAIDEEPDEIAACVLPLPDDSNDHPAIAEARALLPAYHRSLALRGRTNVGRFVTGGEDVSRLVDRFVAISQGVPLAKVAIDASRLRDAASDIRAYYEEAALAIMDHVPLARQVDAWIYSQTEVGSVLIQAMAELKRQRIPLSEWKNLVPAIFHPTEESWFS